MAVLFFVFFVFPIFSLKKNDSHDVTKTKYQIIVIPLFLIYLIFGLIGDDFLKVLPLILAIIMGGFISFMLVGKNYFLRVLVVFSLSFLCYIFYPKYATEISYQKSLVNEHINDEISFLNNDSLKIGKIKNSDKLIILEFWNSACAQCIKAFPKYQEFYEKNKTKYDLYSVNIPWRRDKERRFNASQFVDSLGFNFSVLSMEYESAKKLGIDVFPKIIVIDKNNIIRYRGAFAYGTKNRYHFETILKKIENE